MQNTPNEAPWFAHAAIKVQKLQTAGTAANQLRTATADEVNALSQDLRRGAAKSPIGVDALKAGLADAQHRLTTATENSQARLGLAERAASVLEACRPLQLQHTHSVMPAPKKKTLSAVREEIANLSRDMKEVDNALRPLKEIEADLRSFLAALTKPRDEFINKCVDVLSQGLPVTTLIGHPNLLAEKAFGLALAGIGVDLIVDAALTRTNAKKSNVLRLPHTERAERLATFAKALYIAECEEEQLLGLAERRPCANAAAVLSVPIDVAEKAGLLGVE
jgi:hypothetical protein